MTDETEDAELDVEFEPEVLTEVVQCVNCQIIAPKGFEKLADDLGAVLLRIQDKTGDVEFLVKADKPWKTAGKTNLKAAE
jgi:hypothetical protein